MTRYTDFNADFSVGKALRCRTVERLDSVGCINGLVYLRTVAEKRAEVAPVRDGRWRHLSIVEFFENSCDIAFAHAIGVERENLIGPH